jgi:hypothetical protein
MTASLFGLDTEDFWQNPWKTEEQLVDRYQFGEEYGVFIDVPEVVNLNQYDTVPMLMVYAASEGDAYDIDLERVVKVVVVRLADRRVWVASALESREPGKKPPRLGQGSSDPTSRRILTNLARQTAIAQWLGKYLITVLLRDQVSNRVLTSIEKAPTGFQDPEVRKFLEAHRQQTIPPPPAPPAPPAGDPVPAYSAIEGSPAIPSEPGIALSVTRVVLSQAGARALLKGSFRLPVLSIDLVPPERQPILDEPSLPFYGEPRPIAVIPITLLVLATTSDNEQVLQLRVPVYRADGDMATGHFTLDLFADESTRTIPQTNFIYAFCGEFMAGPATMAVVTENMLLQPGE